MIIGLEDHLSIGELYRPQCAVRCGIPRIIVKIGYSPTVRDQIEEGRPDGKGTESSF
jgi:hypothetical protein